MTDSLRLWATWIGSLSPVPRFAVGILAVLIVAALIGAFLAVIDQVHTYGWPRMKKAIDAPVTIRIAIPARPWSEPAAKGVAGYARIYPVNDPPQRLHTVIQLKARGERIH